MRYLSRRGSVQYLITVYGLGSYVFKAAYFVYWSMYQRARIAFMSRLLSLFFLFFLLWIPGAVAQDKMLIAAASDLKFALDSIVTRFRLTSNGTVDVTYGSSGKLTEQILSGAPFDVFLSADLSYPETLRKKGKTASDIYPYARGHIVLWSKTIDASAHGMKSILLPAVRKIAIANPQHAPYGKRAVECLTFYNLHEVVRKNLVQGMNVSQAAQFVATGAADIGIIALSMALSPAMKKEHGNYFMIPEESYQPLIQGAVITLHGGENKLAADFFEYIKSDDAIAVLGHFGFSTSK